MLLYMPMTVEALAKVFNNRTDEVAYAILGLAADGVKFITFFAEVFGQTRNLASDIFFIALIEDDDLFFGCEFFAEFGEFEIEFFEIVDGIAIRFTAFELISNFDEVNEDARAFEVFEKVVA